MYSDLFSSFSCKLDFDKFILPEVLVNSIVILISDVKSTEDFLVKVERFEDMISPADPRQCSL